MPVRRMLLPKKSRFLNVEDGGRLSSAAELMWYDGAMTDATTILVVGAGRFAATYLNTLSALGRTRPVDLAPIGRVVVTRTSAAAARETAAAWRRSRPTPPFDVVGDTVAHAGHLRRVLAAHRPALTCITARDPRTGDDIHARYAAAALDHGPVLSEKNFAAATGDGKSLDVVDALQRHANARLLGLELPLVPLRDAMMGRSWMSRSLTAAQIRFHWEVPAPGHGGLIPELALHPWSLLPPDGCVRVAAVEARADRADIRLRLDRPAGGPPVDCRIRLGTGGRRRTVAFGELALTFDYARGHLRVLPFHQAARPGETPPRALCRAPNPIRQHIVACLRGRPLVGIDVIRKSQLFLERLAGFKG